MESFDIFQVLHQNLSMMTSLEKTELAKKYYSAVDSGDFTLMKEIFSEKIIYHRCEKLIVGINNLLNFYTNSRKIKGHHDIKEIYSDQGIVIVLGQFVGIDSKSTNIKINFVDFFSFDTDEKKINVRKTFIAAGYEQTV